MANSPPNGGAHGLNGPARHSTAAEQQPQQQQHSPHLPPPPAPPPESDESTMAFDPFSTTSPPLSSSSSSAAAPATDFQSAKTAAGTPVGRNNKIKDISDDDYSANETEALRPRYFTSEGESLAKQGPVEPAAMGRRPSSSSAGAGDRGSKTGSGTRKIHVSNSSSGGGGRARPTKTKGVVALNAAALMDGCDDQLLPASFRALETELKFYPSVLGRITLAQTMALSLSCPFWGFLADRYPRRNIMATGMICWGITTITLAFANELAQVIILRALNGIFLGSIGPISQSILADITHETRRGMHFGFLQMCQSGGRVLGGVVTTSVAMLSFAGFTGWRWTFLSVGIGSLLMGICVALFVPEFSRGCQVPQHTPLENARDVVSLKGDGENAIGTAPPADTRQGINRYASAGEHHGYHLEERHLSFGAFFSKVIRVNFTKPSMILVLLEGIIGTVPWSAMSFMTMYLQYCGFSDTLAGVTASMVLLGAMIAGPIGGYFGDRVNQYSPTHGRPFLGQLSMLGRVPLMIVGLGLLPRDASSSPLMILVCLGVGIFSFAGVVVNRPLMSDVVRPSHRATAFALAVSVEGACAALLGAPVVGLLAENVFGYVRTHEHIADIPEVVRAANARALGHALLALTSIPWTVSFLIYGILHLTYRKDRDNLRLELYRESLASPDGSSAQRTEVTPAPETFVLQGSFQQ